MESAGALIDTQASAKDWELGCAQDAVRNEFIIPALSRLLDDRKPARILDVGAGTGFISRSVDSRLNYRPSWTLIDLDQNRLDISLSSAPTTMQVEHRAQDLASQSWNKDNCVFDAAIVCFTILEFPLYYDLISSTSSCISKDGFMIIITPDPWQEVIMNRELSFTLLSDRVSVEKIDKFTGMSYPYYISRNESLIADVLGLGFSMENIIKPLKGLPVYLMVFRKSAPNPVENI